jgi:WD40 repeat protein/transcriptional regulator with XRE-family HTH domain
MHSNGEHPEPDLIATRPDFSRELSRLRERAGLTVRDVARAVAIRESTAGGYFSGRHLPGARSQDLLAQIVRACGVTDPDEVGRWIDALVRVRRSPGPRPSDEPAPYRGLAAFDSADEKWFHGREELTALVVDRLRGARQPLVVTGPSGCGKSSLLRAGVIPALRRERKADGSPVWDCRIVVPGDQLLDTLDALPPSQPGTTGVLVVDQFEEVFTSGDARREEREEVAAALVRRAGSGRVMLGLRADFWSAAAAQPALIPALQHGQIVVGPMSTAELRRAIVEPARLAAVDLEEGLVELVLRDAGPHGDAAILPLLSHALLATWQRGHGGHLTVADYVDSGGIAGATAQSAESIYQELTADEQDVARRLFLRMVHVDDETADTRRRVPRAELDDAGLLDRWVEQRLVTVDETTVEIAHEALLSAWPRLREWIDADRASLRVHRQLTGATRSWQDSGGDPALLLRGARLAAAEEWSTDPDHRRRLNQAEADFLEASASVAARERALERRRSRRLRVLLAAACSLLVISAILVGYLLDQRRVVERQRDEAVSRRVATDADRLRDADPNLAMQLALAAYRIAPTTEARSSLVESSATPTSTRLLATSGVLQAVAVTADGRTLAAGGAGGQVGIWDVSARSRPRRLATVPGATGSSPTVFAVAVSPDGRTLATGGSDGHLRLWSLTDPAHPRLTSTLVGATGAQPTIFAIAIAPDGRTLAAGGADRVVRRWDLGNRSAPRPLRTLTGPTDYVQAVAFSPDSGELAAGSADTHVYRWNLRTSAALPILSGPTKTVFAVAFSPDGRLLAAGSADKGLHLWSAASGAPQPTLFGATTWINAVAFSPDSTRIAAGGSDNVVRLWAVGNRHGPAATLPHPGPVTAVQFTDGGRTLATSAADGAVRLWQLPGPAVGTSGDSVFSLQYTGGGDRLAVSGGSVDNAVRTWDVRDPRRPRLVGPTVSGPRGAPLTGAMAVSPDGRTIAGGSVDGTVRLWQGATTTTLHGPSRTIQSLAFSPDGRTLAAGSNDHHAWFWRLDDRRHRPVALTGATNYVYGVAFDRTGRYLAAGSADDVVRIWDLTRPGPPVASLTGPASYVLSVAFSPDGRTLAAGGADSKVWLWDVERKDAPVARPPLTGPGNYVYGVTFNRAGTMLAATGGDRTVWVWNTAGADRPTLALRLAGAGDSVLVADFRPDGAWLAAGTADDAVLLWNLDPQQVADFVCAVAGDPVTPAEWDRYVTGVPYQVLCPRT